LTHYASYLVPFVLIGLGIFILLGHTLENRGLVVLTAAIIGFCLVMEVRDTWGDSTKLN
jgi:ABC-type Fe3+ transport system permease subunit